MTWVLVITACWGSLSCEFPDRGPFNTDFETIQECAFLADRLVRNYQHTNPGYWATNLECMPRSQWDAERKGRRK